MKIYFIGGASIKTSDADYIYKDAISKGDKILVFPWTYEEEDLVYRKITEQFFEKFRAKTMYAELSDSPEKLKEKIDASDVIYLPGGRTQILCKNLKRKKVVSYLKKYKKIIIGNSAGAEAFCKEYVNVKGAEESKKTELKHGIELAEIHAAVHYGNPVPHYGGEGDKELIPFSKKVKIYAIPETSALIYENGELSHIGDVYIFDKGKKTLMSF